MTVWAFQRMHLKMKSRKPIGNYLKKYHPDINKEPGAEEKYKEVQEAYETLSDEQNGLLMTNMVLRVPMVASVAEQVVLVALMVLVLVALKTSSLASLVVVQAVIRMHLVKGMTSNTASISSLKKRFLARKKKSSTIGKQAVIPVMVLGLSQGLVRWPVDAVMVLESSMWIRKPLLGWCAVKWPVMSVMVVVKKSKIHVRLVVEQVMKNKLIAWTSRFPAGVETGQQIRLAGQGEAGFNGGPYGDLYVVVNVEPSDRFERDGSTIYYKLDLNFVQAALGDTVHVPTVHGDVDLVIPEGTQTGKKFRLRGKGAPSLRGGAMGDQYVSVNVVTPTGLNDKQKEALQAFAEASDLKVNPKKKGFFDKVKDALDDL